MSAEAPPSIAQAIVLSERVTDKLAVTLWWLKGTLDTFVTVDDNSVEPPAHHLVEVPEGINPNRVFRAPFAYMEYRSGNGTA